MLLNLAQTCMEAVLGTWPEAIHTIEIGAARCECDLGRDLKTRLEGQGRDLKHKHLPYLCTVILEAIRSEILPINIHTRQQNGSTTRTA